MLAHEENSAARIVCEDSAGCFDAVQRGEADVEENQIRPKIGGFLNRLWSIGGLGDNSPARTVRERRGDVTSPRLVIVDNQDALHDRLPSSCGAGSSRASTDQRNSHPRLTVQARTKTDSRDVVSPRT